MTIFPFGIIVFCVLFFIICRSIATAAAIVRSVRLFFDFFFFVDKLLDKSESFMHGIIIMIEEEVEGRMRNVYRCRETNKTD